MYIPWALPHPLFWCIVFPGSLPFNLAIALYYLPSTMEEADMQSGLPADAVSLQEMALLTDNIILCPIR